MVDNNKSLDLNNNYAAGINDLKFQKMIKEQEIKEEKEQSILMKYEKKEAMMKKIKEYKENSTPIFKIRKSLLVTTILCFIFGLFALFSGFIFCGILTIFSGVGTIIVGQNIRIENNPHRLTNVILFNLSKSINDFINYKIPYEIFDNEDRWLDMFTVLGMAIFMFFSSSNPFYGIVFILLILCFLICFSTKNINKIYTHLNLIIPCCVLGLIFKTVYQYLYMAIVDVDLMNVVLINLFSIISIYTENVEITNPNDNIQAKPVNKFK